MAGVCTKINRSAVDFYIAPLGVACTEPPFPTTNTTIGTAAPRSTSAATLTTTALPANFDLASGKFLNFTNPTTGAEVIVQTTARVVEAATSIPVTNVGAALPVGSILQWPLKLTGRTGFNWNRQGNVITVPTFESGGDDEGKVVSRTTTADAPGVQSPLSAAYQTILTLPVGEYLYLWIREKPYDANYTSGLEIKGIVTVVTDNINYNPQDVTRSDLNFQFVGAPVIVQPVLA